MSYCPLSHPDQHKYSSETYFADNHYCPMADAIAEVLCDRTDKSRAEINERLQRLHHGDGLWDFVGPMLDAIEYELMEEKEESNETK